MNVRNLPLAMEFERIEVAGHAGRIGTSPYNAKPSEQRASAVSAYLVRNGIDPRAIRASTKGEAQPVTDDACDNMGAETRKNVKLIECLQPDRRANVAIVLR